MKHTKGPWSLFDVEASSDVRASDGSLIAIVLSRRGETVDAGLEEYAANANLIAAAPELLEAARKALSTYNAGNDPYGQEQAMIELENAIAKATNKGESK